MKKSYIKQAPEYIRQLQAKGEYWFLRTNIQDKLGLSSNATTLALWRLSKKKAICRIHADFYVIIPLEYQSVGCLPPEWFIDALMQHLQLNYYVALLTAASFEGAAHQQVMTFQVMTQKKLRNINAGNQRIVFSCKNQFPSSSFIKQKKTPASYFKISSAELTAVDLVRYIEASGHINHVSTVLYELAEKINVNILSENIRSGSIKIIDAQRLGYILDFIQVNLDLFPLADIIREEKPNYIRLVSSSQKKVIEKNQRWRVFVNESIEVDDL